MQVKICLTLCLLSVLLVGCTKAPTTVTLIDYGIYDATISVKGDWKRHLPMYVSSFEDQRLKTTTLRIPARDGVYFGLRAQITNPSQSKPMVVVCLIEHPSFTNPNGKTSTQALDDAEKIGPGKTMDVNMLWFFLDAASFEYAPGKWTFSVEADGNPVIAKTFEVYK